MAKKKSGTSLSHHIRAYLQENSGATPNQIVEGLGAKGITVSPGLASHVKYTSGATGKRKTMKKISKKKASSRAKKMASGRNAALSANDLFEAKKLADELGGIAEARKALDALEKLK